VLMISDATGALFLLFASLTILLGLKERILVADTSDQRVCQTLRNNKAVAAKAADGIARRRR